MVFELDIINPFFFRAKKYYVTVKLDIFCAMEVTRQKSSSL